MKNKSVNQGFTLLEVLIAVTLTAIVLGNLLALQSQSKRLAFKAEAVLQKTINQRAYFNAAWVDSRQASFYLDDLQGHEVYSTENTKALKKPEAQSKPLKFHLESFRIVDKQGNIVLSSVRLKDTELPE
jgi:prepilin-type N-terminal cleavage/methylation domain-containing protein